MAGRGQVEVGPIAAAAGGVLLVVSLFLDWYEPGISGWTAFEALDLLLAALGLAAVGVLAVRLGVPLLGGERGLLGGPAAPLVGALALVVVASQVFNHPPAAVDRGADVGQWLALSGAGLMLAGGALGFARLSVAVSFDERRSSSSVTRSAGSDDPTEQLGAPE
jgi:hypothetical protein